MTILILRVDIYTFHGMFPKSPPDNQSLTGHFTATFLVNLSRRNHYVKRENVDQIVYQIPFALTLLGYQLTYVFVWLFRQFRYSWSDLLMIQLWWTGRRMPSVFERRFKRRRVITSSRYLRHRRKTFRRLYMFVWSIELNLERRFRSTIKRLAIFIFIFEKKNLLFSLHGLRDDAI